MKSSDLNYSKSLPFHGSQGIYIDVFLWRIRLTFELLKCNVRPESFSRLSAAFGHPPCCVYSHPAMPSYARALRERLWGDSCYAKTQLWLIPLHRL